MPGSNHDESSQDNACPHPDSSADRLAALGWDEGWSALRVMSHPPDLALRPGRVARVDRGRVRVLTHSDDIHVPLYGPHTPSGSLDPVTGDWVLLDDRDRLHAVLPRRTDLTRGAGRRDTRAQVLAANVDVALIVLALTSPPNHARLDRMLTLVFTGGVTPVVVLTKSDLCAGARAERDEVAEGTPGVPVLLTSVVDGNGLDELAGQLAPGRTAALLGVSGSGKSSLINTLAGTELMPVGEVRADGKGRHTTTRRDLIPLPGLGVLIDTPGIRGVQLWDADEGLEHTFADIEELVGRCRFSDCRHSSEPDCAVSGAIADGRLSADRLASYIKLQREAAWLRSRHDARLRAEARQQLRRFSRATRGRGRGRRS